MQWRLNYLSRLWLCLILFVDGTVNNLNPSVYKHISPLPCCPQLSNRTLYKNSLLLCSSEKISPSQITTVTLHSMEQSPSWEADTFSARQEIPRILWNPKVLYRIHKAHHLFLFWVSSIQSIPPHSTYWKSILILSSHLRLVLPSGLFPSGFPTKTLYTPLPHTCHMLRPSHSSRF